MHHGTKQTFAINRGKKLLLPISVLKSRGLGEERGKLPFHLATSVHLAAAQRLPNVVPATLTVLVVIGHSLIIAYFLDSLFLPICS